MELKHKLEHIFNNDYPGTERFIADVIEPIFGNEIEYINDDLAEREEYATKAKNAGIKRIKYIGNLTEKNYNADNIAILDVMLDDSKNIERSRVNIQQLIRSIMDYRQHLMIVFHYEDVTNKQWRFSYAYKGDSLKDTTSAKRYTYVFGKGYRGRTAAERFHTLADSPRNNDDFEKAFSVAALSDEFFDLYRAYYSVFVEYLTGEKYTDEKKLNAIIGKWNWFQKDESDQFTTTFDNNAKDVRDYIKKMFGRIVFLYFLQRKGWLYDSEGNPDPRYMRHLFDGSEERKSTFLDDVLELLFFYVLNTKPELRVSEASLANKDITILPGWEKIPFLNGGLFSQDEIDPKRCVFPAVYFDELFSFLDSYNFTIDENDPEDAEVGIDPEMLGRIFENLLEDNKDKGAYYTPKEIVDYMCRESIIAYLQHDKFSDKGNDLIRKFIETLNIDLLDAKQRDYIEDRLLKVKICDPAIGSGAFPMGLVNLLSKIFIVLRTYKTIDQAKMKRYIMQNSIYGVDIEQGAVDIARLRFWLAMVVEENEPQPLPNLHFKIMQGNSLLECYKGHDLSDLTKFESEVVPGTFDFGPNHESVELNSLLHQYYGESDHTKRARMLTSIKHNVVRQMLGKGVEIDNGLDITSNSEFFLWHTWFAEVFEKGGFDIVIGNPPYIDSETMTNSQPELRNTYKKLYSTACGNWDIFIVFIELGVSLLKEHGVFSYIIPNKVIAAKYAEASRRLLCNHNLKIIRDYGSVPVFEAAVYPCVILLTKDDAVSDKMFQTMKDLVNPSNTAIIPYATFSDDLFWDKYFIDQAKLDIILKVSNQPKLSTYEVEITGAATVAEAYKIKEVLTELDATQSEPYLRFINTGTIDKYKSLWGIKKTQYIKGAYQHPIVKTQDLQKINKNRVSQSLAPKIIIAGMSSSIEAIFDGGEIIAGKSTSIIRGDNQFLKAILAVINSKLLDFWLRINFNSLKMAGGYINVGVNEISSLPIHSAAFDVPTLIGKVDKLLLQSDDNTTIDEIDHIVYHLYGLTYDEVLIVDPQTPISREEYESFNSETYGQP